MERRLRELLAEAHVDLSSPTNADVGVALTVFKQLASQRAKDVTTDVDGDLLLAQFGTYDWGHGEHFELDLTRQFAIADRNGESSHMTQLHCTFEFPSTDEASGLGSGELWSSGFVLGDFFEQVERLAGFTYASAANLVPSRARVDYEQV